MLGIYDYTVVLTYVSLMVSIGGMMLSVNGHLNLAVLCLAISGLSYENPPRVVSA